MNNNFIQTQFQYIVDLVKLYKSYSDNSEIFYKAINELQPDTFQDIYKEYGYTERNFQPVNFLRAEVARLLIESKEITDELVEEIKEKIRNKEKY